MRLLVPNKGTPTFVTRRLPLSLDDALDMAERLPYVADMGDVRMEVHKGQGGSRLRRDFTVAAGKYEARGRRLDLHESLWKF